MSMAPEMPEMVSLLAVNVVECTCWRYQFFGQGKQLRTYLVLKASDTPKLKILIVPS